MSNEKSKQELIFEKLLSYSRDFGEAWDAVRTGDLELECNEGPFMFVGGFTVDDETIFAWDFNKWLEEKESASNQKIKVDIGNYTEESICITEEKYLPKTDKEKMLVETLLRKCRGGKVEFKNIHADELSPIWVSDGDSCLMNLDLTYRTPLSKLDKLREEIETKLDTSALDVFDVILNEFDEIRGKLEK